MSSREATLSARIHDLLAAAITDGRLGTGRLIRETHIAKLVGSSRMPIKQALARLQEDGVIRRLDGRGYVVGAGPITAEISRMPLTADCLGLEIDEGGTLKTRVSTSIYDRVENELLHCSIFGRFRVNEQQLAKRYGVSRTVAHDVLMLAQVNGILVKDERSRWYTVPLDEHRAHCLYELREVLEPLALAGAAQALPAADIKAMIDRLDAAEAIYPDLDPGVLDSLEIDLHVQCLSASPNQEVVEVLKRTRCVLIFSKHILGREIPLPVQEPFFAEHRQILEAIAARDTALITQRVRDHLRRSRDTVVQRVAMLRTGGRVPDLSYVKEQQAIA